MSHKIWAVIATVALSITVHAGTTPAKALNINPLIVGGNDVVKGELPFQVSIQSNGTSHFCGGSLIKPNWVLTAAHCVAGWSSSNKVFIGLHDRTDKSNAEAFTVTKVIANPKYDSQKYDYDFALLQLSGDSKFRPIELNATEIAIPEDAPDQIKVWTAGWGTLSSGSSSLPRILQKVEVPLVSQKNCNLPTAYDGKVSDRMICAGYQQGGKDSCQGDSGGPLYMQRASGDPLLVGVVSWGYGCAAANKYGVYSKVNSQIDWIAEQTK
jgi:trypsin